MYFYKSTISHTKNKKRERMGCEMKKLITLLSTMLLLMCLTACGGTVPEGEMKSEDEVKLTFEASFYRNNGDLWMIAEGTYFNITPNKTQVWSYDSSGSYIKSYDTSSVVTVQIDENFLESCGETIIFKDSRLEMQPFPDTTDLVIDTSNNEKAVMYAKNYGNIEDYLALRHWWIDYNEKGQGGSKLVLIQSQDGFDIGMFTGDNITWQVAEKLPKTTLIEVDGKKLYIHRCNFVIIDTKMLE